MDALLNQKSNNANNAHKRQSIQWGRERGRERKKGSHTLCHIGAMQMRGGQGDRQTDRTGICANNTVNAENQ